MLKMISNHLRCPSGLVLDTGLARALATYDSRSKPAQQQCWAGNRISHCCLIRPTAVPAWTGASWRLSPGYRPGPPSFAGGTILSGRTKRILLVDDEPGL